MIERYFAGEVRRFDYSASGRFLAIEERCGCGLGEVIGRLWTVIGSKVTTALDSAGNEVKVEFKDVPSWRWGCHTYRETILQGLIGGGMMPDEARRLIEREVDGFRPEPFAEFALDLLLNLPKSKALEKKREAAEAPAESTPTPSMEQVLR